MGGANGSGEPGEGRGEDEGGARQGRAREMGGAN